MEDVNCALAVRKHDGIDIKNKIKNWYINNIANNVKTFDNLFNFQVTAHNAAGSVALGIFFPELLPLVPAIQKGYKTVKKFEYDTGKKIIHKALDIKDEEINKKPALDVTNAFSEEEIENVVKNVGNIVAKKADINNELEETGGLSR